MDAVHPQIKRSLVSGLLDGQFDLLLGLCHNLLDPSRMNTAVSNKLLQGDLGYLAAHRIKPGEDNRLGGIVDNQVDAGSRFQRPDVAPFTADDASFHLIRRESHYRYGPFRDILAGIA